MEKLINQSQSKKLRRILRQQPITCERILWNKIRNRQLGGLKFKRQVSIGKFIVDFYCPGIKLVIEIDGATHGTEKELQADEIRQKFLENQGLIVKRFTNTDIKLNLELVLENILIINNSSLTPSLSRLGEGAKQDIWDNLTCL